jgi:hypothetical protein
MTRNPVPNSFPNCPRRMLEDQKHVFRILLDRLAATAETRREVNRLSDMVRQELRRRVKQKQRQTEWQKQQETP